MQAQSMALRVNEKPSASEAMQLLQKPSEGEDTFSEPLKRSSCSYEDGCERFRVRERRFQQQYANLYFMRLSRMRGMVEATARNKWGKSLNNACTGNFILGELRQKPAIWTVVYDDHLPVSSAGPHCPIRTIPELHNNRGEKCCVIGTLFKKMELQPSILKELSVKVGHLIGYIKECPSDFIERPRMMSWT